MSLWLAQLVPMLAGTLTLAGIGLASALLLAMAARRYADNSQAVTQAINELLPQTQCAQCGYPGCRPYAEAITQGEAINKCPPGGEITIKALADLLGRAPAPLDPSVGATQPARVAVIREDECIGCTLCLPACPVDAIVGAPQLMHTVITSECTGCDLCLPPCPVDCIDMVQAPTPAIPLPRKPRLLERQVSSPIFDCIKCGFCEPVCPRDLAPQALYWHREQPEQLQALNLDACIECRLCDRVCPSNLPLTETFAAAKKTQRQRARQSADAERARVRYENHELRQKAKPKPPRQRPSKGDRRALIDSLKRPSQ